MSAVQLLPSLHLETHISESQSLTKTSDAFEDGILDIYLYTNPGLLKSFGLHEMDSDIIPPHLRQLKQE
ncbi:hypothetical protein ACN38_g10205 [Penicillium nordicum]|uniref:Uncharacterized protein n=1 Tax=Penicillium nordicum TaxID=229535 RepID=A0A0M8P2A7_9EURO|nr:hypothetical protein ACN38_g10205 [Penicillium nordicum]